MIIKTANNNIHNYYLIETFKMIPKMNTFFNNIGRIFEIVWERYLVSGVQY